MSKTRGNGEGTVSLRSDGRWCARLSLPDGQRKYFYGATRKEATERMAKAKADALRGLPIPSERQTLGQFLNSWLANVAKMKVRPKTYDRYEEYVRLHIVPAIGKVKLSRLTPQHVQQLLTVKASSGLAPRTVFHMRAVLRTALNQAVRWRLMAYNPAALADPPRVPHREMQALDPDQAQRLLDALDGQPMEALVTVALALGLRLGEALGLRWQDVDLKARTLSVRQTLQRVNGAFDFGEPKSATSRRTVRLPETAVAAMHAHRARQLQERLLVGEQWEESGLVFTSATGGPLEPSRVSHRFKDLLAAAGLPPIRFHDLRHSCASLLLAQHVSARQVMELLGHSNIGLTLGTYSHVMPALAQETADQMDAVLTRRRDASGDQLVSTLVSNGLAETRR